jgi:N-methylhydantoinase A
VQERGRELRPSRLADGGPKPDAALRDETPIWAHGRSLGAKLYDRAKLLAHNVIEGPAIVTEMDSTTLVLPGHFGEVDGFGNILIRPKQ